MVVNKVGNLYFLQPNNFTVDRYSLLTDKMFKTVINLYEHYNDFDWYFKADDDTFAFIKSLKYFLQSKDPSLPVTYGYDFRLFVEKGYHSGGKLNENSFLLLIQF